MKYTAVLLMISFLSFRSISATAQPSADTSIKARINHIAVYVYDLQKSRDFYEQVVGLKWMPNPFNDGMHEWFAIGGGAQLHLIKGATAVTEHVRNAHLCFSVASVDSFIFHLKKFKTPYINWNGDKEAITLRVDGVKQIYFKDPDGYWVEINDDNGH